MATHEERTKIFVPQNKPTLKEWITTEIKRAILEGRLKAGERLNESKIAEEMSVSKSPLREAINDLVNEGFLVSEPYKGTRVKGLSKKEVEELYSLRAVLEVFAAELAIQSITERDFVVFERIVSAMEEAAKGNDIAGIVERDLEFHHYLVKLSGHGILLEVWEKIYGRLKMFMTQKDHFFKNLEEVAALHKVLFEKLQDSDIPGFKKALQDHIIHYATIAIHIFD